MFRCVFTVLLLTMPLTLYGSDPAQSAEDADRVAIKSVLDAHGAAWTRGDADAATATLTEDADWVSGTCPSDGLA